MATKETKDATDATADDGPVDTRDALEVLESEAKEWDKVRPPAARHVLSAARPFHTDSVTRMPRLTAF